MSRPENCYVRRCLARLAPRCFPGIHYCKKLLVQFPCMGGFAKRIENGGQRAEFADLDGVLVLGELDGLTCIAQCEERLAGLVGEPARTKTLLGFDTNAISFRVLPRPCA